MSVVLVGAQIGDKGSVSRKNPPHRSIIISGPTALKCGWYRRGSSGSVSHYIYRGKKTGRAVLTSNHDHNDLGRLFF